jgi:hypothetical protein
MTTTYLYHASRAEVTNAENIRFCSVLEVKAITTMSW